MRRLTQFFSDHTRAAWLLVLGVGLVVGATSFTLSVRRAANERLQRLQADAQRTGLEIGTTTLNGSLMGAISLLGVLDRDIKQEASNGLASEDAHVPMTVSTLGNFFGVDAVFIVGGDGIVKTSWDKVNKPSTGLEVGFRPYFQSAIKGQSSVYAAVSMTVGDRSLYFAAPVYAENARGTVGTGAIVARSGVQAIENLLKQRLPSAVLLSPQGVAFMATERDWIGRMAGVPTPQRLQSLRALKQFGSALETNTPQPLAQDAQTGLQWVAGRPWAVALAPVYWNDPAGDWQVMAMDDLSATLSLRSAALMASATSVLTWLLGLMWLSMLRGRREQSIANAQLQAYAQEQQAQIRLREQMAQTALRLQRCDALESLAQVFLSEAHALFGVQQGVVYAVAADQSLALLGSRACAAPAPATLALGEGLLGECARERQANWIAAPAGGIWRIDSGLGSAPAQVLLLAPLVLHDQLIGAVELAFLQAPSDATRQAIDEMLVLLSHSLEILRRKLPPDSPTVSAAML